MVFAVNDGGMVLEGYFFELESESLVYAFILQMSSLLFLYLFYRVFFNGCHKGDFFLKNGYGFFLAVVQVAFLIFNISAGVNVAGVESKGGLVNYIFILLQPDLLFLLIGVCLISNKLFWVNCLIFLISMFLRGWMGGVFVVIILLMCRMHPMRVSLRVFFGGAFASVLFFASIPVIIEAKWAMRTGMSVVDFFSSLPSPDSESYEAALRYLLNRFQHVGHVALILENSERLQYSYLKGSFIPYWADGLPQMFFYKILGIEYIKLNSYMVGDLFGLPDVSWNTNPGIAGWFGLLGMYGVGLFVYLSALLLVSFGFVRQYGGGRVVLLISCFSLVYLYHGWIGAFFNMVFFAIIFLFFVRVRLFSGHAGHRNNF